MSDFHPLTPMILHIAASFSDFSAPLAVRRPPPARRHARTAHGAQEAI